MPIRYLCKTSWLPTVWISLLKWQLPKYVLSNKFSSPPGPRLEEGRPPKSSLSFCEKLKDLTRPEMMRPLRLVVLFFFFYHCGGLTGLRPYMVITFKQLELKADPYWLTVSMCLHVASLGITFSIGLRSNNNWWKRLYNFYIKLFYLSAVLLLSILFMCSDSMTCCVLVSIKRDWPRENYVRIMEIMKPPMFEK